MMKISIVSSFYNDKEMLIRVLDSVLEQTYQNIEHVVKDAASTDGSVEVLKEYEEKYCRAGKKLVWKSEKDDGLTQGFNEAYAMATGDYYILAVDPYVDDTVIEYIAEKLYKYDLDYTYGGMYFQKDGKIVRRWSGKPGNWHLGWMMATPTMVIKKDLWKKYGPLDEKYRGGSDYKFQIQLFQDESLKTMSLNKVLVNYYAGGTSNGDLKGNWNSIKESYLALMECKVKFAWLTTMCKILIALCAYVFASHKKIELED